MSEKQIVAAFVHQFGHEPTDEQLATFTQRWRRQQAALEVLQRRQKNLDLTEPANVCRVMSVRK